MSKEEILNYINPFMVIATLSSYERLIYAVLLKLKNHKQQATIENIAYDSILYAEKNHTTIKEGETLQKILKKLATFDKTTQTWNLKSNEKILQAIRAKHQSKPNILIFRLKFNTTPHKFCAVHARQTLFATQYQPFAMVQRQ